MTCLMPWHPRNPLTTRWTAEERREINRAFSRGAFRFLDDLSTVRHGRVTFVDLRGFPFEARVTVDLTRVDLTDCNMQFGGIGGARVRLTRCLFGGARLWTTIGYDVRRCDFSAAHLKGADLRGTFRDCVFAGANLVGVRTVPGSRFIRCDFRGAKLRNLRLYDAVFDNCLWDGATIRTGSVAGSRFVGTRPTPEQLGDTILESDVPEELDREIAAEVAAESRRRAAAKGWRTRRRKRRSAAHPPTG
jgi:uncharacterized protein YjbI with pentapeptide repeats